MFIKLGICIMVWLIVGFIVGVKSVYIDRITTKMLDENDKERFLKNFTPERAEHFEMIWTIAQKKSVFIIMSTLLGFFAFYADTVGTFKKKRK